MKPKNLLPENLVKAWGLTIDESKGRYLLNGREIPDLPQVKGDVYLEKNRGFDTASKLKLFFNCPFSYFLKYILELDLGDKSDESHFVVGNGVDYYVSYAKQKFNEKYYLPELGEKTFKPEALFYGETDIQQYKLSPNLLGELIPDSNNIFSKKHLDKLDFEISSLSDEIAQIKRDYPKRGTTTKENALEALKAKRPFIEKALNRTVLAPADADLVKRIITEADRQTLFDLHNTEYKTQVLIKAEFKDLKIAGTLDREDVKNNVIRDTKTIADQLNRKFKKTCNMAIEEYGYDFSMAFYEFLRWAHNKAEGREVRSRVILDFFGKAPTVRYLCYEIPEEVINEKRETIISVLNYLKKCREQKDFPTMAEISNNPDAFLESPYYQYNPGAIQKTPAVYQPYDLD